jgi:5-methylcytosine-specific restriction endonuclease McrA
MIERYDRHPDGIARLNREAGLSKRRHLAKLERDGQLRLLGPGGPESTPAVAGTGPGKPRIPLIHEDEESRHPEGAASYRLHRQLERDTSLAEKAKQKRLAETGCLSCDVCGFDFEQEYGELGAGYIEAHHTVPVSQLTGDTKTQLSDLALVCSNCHRMLHRGPRLLTIDELRALRQNDE